MIRPALLALLTLLAVPAAAYERSRTEAGDALEWGRRCVAYHLHEDGSDDIAFGQLLEADDSIGELREYIAKVFAEHGENVGTAIALGGKGEGAFEIFFSGQSGFGFFSHHCQSWWRFRRPLSRR